MPWSEVHLSLLNIWEVLLTVMLITWLIQDLTDSVCLHASRAALKMLVCLLRRYCFILFTRLTLFVVKIIYLNGCWSQFSHLIHFFSPSARFSFLADSTFVFACNTGCVFSTYFSTQYNRGWHGMHDK